MTKEQIFTEVDPRKTTPEERDFYVHQAQLLFKFNHTMPYTDEYNSIPKKLFGEFGDGSAVQAPLKGVCFDKVKVGNNVMIMPDCLMMSRGGIVAGNPAKIIKMID
ncbi:MAG: hypothetical protein IJR06_02665 [Paludibacteraceae bacterium]|nr:hypothetical protein [Paludibacteraceae bacterium]